MEVISEKQPDKLPEMIIKTSGFLNHFLFDIKDELIPLSLEVKLIDEFLEIHRLVLGNRLNSKLVVNGNLQAHVCPPRLLLPFINSAIKLVYNCNNSFESTVLIKAEKKYLLLTFTFWSNDNFRLFHNEESRITKQRLMSNFPQKHRIIENEDDNFTELSLEIFN